MRLKKILAENLLVKYNTLIRNQSSKNITEDLNEVKNDLHV